MEHRSNLNNPLSSDDLGSLKNVAAGLVVTELQYQQLKQLGLIDQKLGGWALTSLGNTHLAMGK
jgi:hypothetical protein